MELNEIQQKISSSLVSGLVDQRSTGSESLMPQFIYNEQGDTMLLHIDRELSQCSSFTFVVAFITESALTALKVKLADLALRGVRGRIITADYLNFNKPKVFEELQRIPNVTVRIAQTPNFHAKGYLFDHADQNYQSAIIGSSNLTENAILMNYEWNIRLTSYQNGLLTGRLIQEVEAAWHEARPLTDAWIEGYRVRFDQTKSRQIQEVVTDVEQTTYDTKRHIKPNQMQAEALKNLANLRKQHAKKALIISATGTGKTYLGAFDVKNYRPHKFLYIVHREQILNKTMASFKKVLRSDYYQHYQGKSNDWIETHFAEQFGVVSGNQKNFKARYVFATIQTLSRAAQLHQFDPKQFDYILVDEAHRAGAETYQRVLNYFQPNFMLGMTATPERMDDFNLFEMFDYHIAYEIRLQAALDEKMLCPFRYIGITDYERDGQSYDNPDQLRWLVADERVDYIIRQTNYYGYSGDVLHGLIFCSRTDEAHELARILTARGIPSAALTGATPQEERQQLVKALEAGDLNYLITVDVFNEGVDIPCVNQLVMLRQTQSSIIFIQQLGRGLRLDKSKEYVTVIDFIGKYKNNYLIPIALTGDKSRNKDTAHEDLEVRQISGVSTISFSEIAKKRIYESITNTSLDSLKVLRDDYRELKNRIGRIPLLSDFQQYGTVDCQVFANKYRNYYQFLLKMKESVYLEKNDEAFLSFISMELMNGKRKVELSLLRRLLIGDGRYAQTDFDRQMYSEQVFYNSDVRESMLRILSLKFYQKALRHKYGETPFVTLTDGVYQLNVDVLHRIQQRPFFKQMVMDAIHAGLIRARNYDQTKQFTLYQRYTRKDVCRLLGWDKDESSTVYGYRVKKQLCPIFVTYHKAADVEESLNYQDQFLDQNFFEWYSRHNVKIDSKPFQDVLAAHAIHLFIKRTDDEGKDFIYFGQVQPTNIKQEMFRIKDSEEPIVKTVLRLIQPVRYDKYLLLEE